MRKIIYLYILLILYNCESINQLHDATTRSLIDFKSWHNAVMSSFENKTGYSKGATGEFGTALGVVHSALLNYSEAHLIELFNRSNARSGNWDKLFIVDLFIEGETSYQITSILLYDKSKYRGVSFDGEDFFNLKYINKFKIWELKSKSEYGNNSYIAISEFDEEYKNINNQILIGVPFHEINENLLKIYNDTIFD